MYLSREAKPEDVHALAALLRAYMLETYCEEWRGNVAGLLRDGLGARFRTLIAQLAEEAEGFLAWERSYDLHYLLSGGHVLDLYVDPRHRARGVAVQLIARAAAIVQSDGGAFIKGARGEPSTPVRERASMAGSHRLSCNDYILGGKAFRHLAARSDLPIRKLARSMPEKRWNFDP
ncbi:MAG TPA: hypothetical protein VMT66_00485 [Steroidobacteraceae bacterium]|nr:hypothetical protein [Steroidobacteraceae bacterium]